MPTAHSLKWRRLWIPVVVSAMVAALMTFAQPSAAQDVATTFEVQQGDTPPVLTATVTEAGMELTWTYDRPQPAGWQLFEFDIIRKIDGYDTGSLLKPATGTDRTYTDGINGAARNAYWDGADVTYQVRAAYKRNSDGFELPGRSSNEAVVEGAATLSQIKAGYQVSNLSATAHADGVLMEWEFDAEQDSPPGWKLVGFGAGRYLSSNIHDVTMFLPLSSLDPTQRSAKDPMRGVGETQRMPGFDEWNYGVVARFESLASGAYGSRQHGKSTIVSFTAPTLPPPTNVTVETTSRPSQIRRNDYVRWDPPHLSWDAELGFNSVSEYIVYRWTSTSEWMRARGHYRDVPFSTSNTCWFGFWVRVRIGLFFSDQVRAKNNRNHPCI